MFCSEWFKFEEVEDDEVVVVVVVVGLQNDVENISIIGKQGLRFCYGVK